MTVCLNRHWGEESILWPSRGKEKQVQRPWSRVPGKPRKTRHSVLKRQQNYFVTELLSYIPIRQNKHITSKQRKAQELYSIVCGHNSLLQWGKGLVVVWFFNCVLFIVSILSQKKVEGHFWFLGNLQNHKRHLLKYVSMTYNITSLGIYNHTILNFWSLGYSWNRCILSAKDPKGHTHLFWA